MKTINLIDLDKSEVKYDLTTFPDGEPHIKLEEIDRKKDYKVACRIANPTDLFILMQVADILNRQAVEWELDIYYLMSMRMDRVINFNEAFTLNMVANIINGFKAKKVRVYHAHSERTAALINNYVDMESEYNNIVNPDRYYTAFKCYPDAGAAERYGAMRVINSVQNHKIIVMNKVRDLDNKGVIKSIEILHEPPTYYDGVREIMIYDDLCDAGGTFCWAAKILREKYPNAQLAINIRHLVNPIGLKKLSENFDNVYITNSYKDWSKDVEEGNFKNVEVIDVVR